MTRSEPLRSRLVSRARTLLALLCGTLPVCPQNVNNATIQTITSALRAGQYVEARQLATEALGIAPQDIGLLTLQGLACARLGDDVAAMKSFERALKSAPNYVPALEGSAEIEYRRGGKTPTPNLDHLLLLRPDDETAHAMRAVLASRNGDCNTALTHFARSQHAITTQEAALGAYGACLVKVQKYAQAIPVFTQLVTSWPSDRNNRYKLAALQRMTAQHQSVIDTLKPLLETKDPEALNIAANAYEDMGNTPEAVKLLRDAITQAPDRVQAYLDFASISFAHNSHQAGIEMITVGLQRMPNSPELHLARGVLYVQINHLDQAEADFTAADRLAPAKATSSVARALTKYQQNQRSEALAIINDELKTQPKDAFLYYLKAEILSSQGPRQGSIAYNDAVRAALRALELQPDLVLARHVLSRLYLDAGETTAAVNQCKLALRQDPYDQVALYRLMRAMRQNKAPGQGEQISQLMKRFNEAREKGRQREIQESRYRLLAEPGVR